MKLTTDEGQSEFDPPVAVAIAAKEAVGRMRWRGADSILPGPLPTRPDTEHTSGHRRIALVLCIAGLGRLTESASGHELERRRCLPSA